VAGSAPVLSIDLISAPANHGQERDVLAAKFEFAGFSIKYSR
jgi:hypothetical protein